MLKAGSNYTCLAVMTIDSALKRYENYYLQVFLKEYKYVEKEMIRHITEDLQYLLISLMKNKLVWVSFLERKI